MRCAVEGERARGVERHLCRRASRNVTRIPTSVGRRRGMDDGAVVLEGDGRSDGYLRDLRGELVFVRIHCAVEGLTTIDGCLWRGDRIAELYRGAGQRNLRL